MPYTLNDHIDKAMSSERKIARYELYREGSKFYLVLPSGEKCEFDKLKVLIDVFYLLRDTDYKNSKDIEIYDRDKKIRYTKIHRILLLWEELEEERLMRNRIRRHRLVGTKRIMPVSKIDPRLTRPILREEKTW